MITIDVMDVLSKGVELVEGTDDDEEVTNAKLEVLAEVCGLTLEEFLKEVDRRWEY